ncbi:MAG TPA: prepilin-type N-terminal cleavage/methylation domain-containing protein [Firmicutes bacterium]|jgi:prepilin-type N-terminal cleavage/methylation domain-containing protein|nr:prepilin-type N-terminal cleavage/methylation domain-containing protein [Bacillota bacterium]
MVTNLDERGMTLIEVLVALVLLSVILLPLVGTLATGFIVTGEGNRITTATALAQQEMERLLAGIDEPFPPALLPDGYWVNTVVTDNGDGTEKITVIVKWGDSRTRPGEISLTSLRHR